MKKLNHEEGFTLVELMVVVAIIGILSAVAIPNFKKYQAKSKTSEAKLQLASLYTAETAMMSDFDTFATCLDDMGYSDPGNAGAGNNYYAVGFAAESVDANGIAVSNGGVCASDPFYVASKTVGGQRKQDITEATALVPSEGDVFIAAAEGYISADGVNDSGADGYSRFTIDQDKALRQVGAFLGY